MAGEPKNSRTMDFEKAAAYGDEPERIVALLRSWDTDGDGMFSVQEVMSAARQMMAERKTSKALTWVVFIVAAVYVATIALILAVVVGAVELSKDSKPDASGNLLGTHGAKNVVRTKSKTDVASPFDFASQPLADFEKLDGLYIDDLMASNGEVMERYYKVEQITKNKAKDSVKIDFFGGDYLDVDSERALLFRPEPESGCGAEAEGIDAPKGYCAVAEIKNGDDPRDEEDSTRRRQLQARSSIVGPAYNTGPRGIGSNVNFNSGRIYGSDGIVSLGRSRFFGQGQFRSCSGPACQF
ncbi:unnamed protein product [Vitrella brassicaformis CCMP3155]|uniref:EF-hand domain-containing protein n=1 Tax=Vitrella brassicaformis (strain CCMP3155) TaxID=1169540 RepID=A0A0G4H2Z2_VITBC|nr:unnamed protein product [Vitrella brassicaformis CCMP3155]|eukprot:CEM37952.1 unnamed protein product [Vitrella brassicaformis CCMP3155]